VEGSASPQGRFLQEAGWAPGPVWTGAENLAHTGIRSPDSPARSHSLYRLNYPTHILWRACVLYWLNIYLENEIIIIRCSSLQVIKQHLWKMSTWGKRRLLLRADNLTMCRMPWNMGASTCCNPQGLSKPVWDRFTVHDEDTSVLSVCPLGRDLIRNDSDKLIFLRIVSTYLLNDKPTYIARLVLLWSALLPINCSFYFPVFRNIYIFPRLSMFIYLNS
jgi:hypothetical protein